DEKSNAGEAIIAVCKDKDNNLSLGSMEIGEYRGFKMSLSFNAFYKEYTLALKNSGIHRITLGESAIGNITRIENALNGIAEKLEAERDHLSSLYKQMEDVKDELTKPFSHEEELTVKSARLNDLNIQLNLDKHENESCLGNDDFDNDNESENESESEKSHETQQVQHAQQTQQEQEIEEISKNSRDEFMQNIKEVRHLVHQVMGKIYEQRSKTEQQKGFTLGRSRVNSIGGR
ncbi:MAG: hypothetical protein FWF87_09145, partial [Synergistaceae bacterium]|nr:hypothetical protein [Synergistaceae bacterium]